MKGIALTSLLAISIAAPAFAAVGDLKITKTASSAPCTDTTLDTPTGPAALEADWTANTITINWDAKNGTTIPSSDCTYDDTITLPATPSKTGYTFGGWTVKAGPAQCSTTVSTSTDGIDYLSKSPSGKYCYYYNEDTGDEIQEDTGSACVNSIFSGLSTGEWQTNFSYGVVKGIAKCSAKSGNNSSSTWSNASSNWTATESELTSASGEAKYCWCQLSTYTPNGGEMCSVASPSWVFSNTYSSASRCADRCAGFCASYVQRIPDFRGALFGSLGQ